MLRPDVTFRIFRERLAKRRERSTDIERASAYHTLLSQAERTDALDDRTWRDLDLDDVFATVDRTVSQPGQQFLDHLLRTPGTTPQPLERLERVVRAFGAGGSVTER